MPLAFALGTRRTTHFSEQLELFMRLHILVASLCDAADRLAMLQRFGSLFAGYGFASKWLCCPCV